MIKPVTKSDNPNQNAEIDKLKKEKFISVKREANIRKAFLHLRSQFKNSESEFRQAEQERSNRISQLQDEIRDFGHALGGLRKEYNEAKEKLDLDRINLENDNESLRLQILDKRRELKSANKTLFDIEMRVGNAQKELNALIKNKEPFDLEVARFNKQKEEFEEQRREFDLWKGQEESDLKAKKQKFNQQTTDFAKEQERQDNLKSDNEKERVALENLREALKVKEQEIGLAGQARIQFNVDLKNLKIREALLDKKIKELNLERQI